MYLININLLFLDLAKNQNSLPFAGLTLIFFISIITTLYFYCSLSLSYYKDFPPISLAGVNILSLYQARYLAASPF